MQISTPRRYTFFSFFLCFSYVFLMFFLCFSYVFHVTFNQHRQYSNTSNTVFTFFMQISSLLFIDFSLVLLVSL